MKIKIVIASVIIILAVLVLFYSYQNSKNDQSSPLNDSTPISSDSKSDQIFNEEDALKSLGENFYVKTESIISGLPDTNPGISLNPIKGVYKNPF